jgi:hypothetical protein
VELARTLISSNGDKTELRTTPAVPADTATDTRSGRAKSACNRSLKPCQEGVIALDFIVLHAIEQ